MKSLNHYYFIQSAGVILSVLKIDHVHLYVNDLAEAEVWYKEVLGFTRDESLLFWFTQDGPLVLKHNDAALSLFERQHHAPGHTVAFSVKASYFNELMTTLSEGDSGQGYCI